MNKQWTLTKAAFDKLLNWLDQDRNLAGQKYEEIRRRLIEIFACRGCKEAEELADETINRVTSKVVSISGGYIGNPAHYFYGVAQKIHLEYLRRKPPPDIMPQVEEPFEVEEEYECLKHCMQSLTPDSRELILEYYEANKREKIQHRKNLAREMGIEQNALRVRAYRIKAALQRCIEDCLKRKN
jgi:RNA polymerase sigma factor (sigma-70 family)